ncbi:hypothetical protein ACT9XH_02685 [Methanococcoides methylutens]|uniref:hypothetical protein n=1 Tax=Methanococcoides methylutens TaxID=2226 RepID=UPI004044AB21
MGNQDLETIKRTGTGLAFILSPLFFSIAFVAHPNLFSLEIGGEISTRVAEFHGNPFIHFGHFMMLLSVPLLIVVSLKLMDILNDRSPWIGFIGCVMAVFGAVVLAVDKTALCLVMSAFDTLPEAEYVQLLPGIEALFNFEGYLAILYLLPLLPIGFLIQGIGLYRVGAVPRWQSAALIVSSLGLLVSAAVDIDLFGLVATVILAICFVPTGIQIIKGDLE